LKNGALHYSNKQLYLGLTSINQATIRGRCTEAVWQAPRCLTTVIPP